MANQRQRARDLSDQNTINALGTQAFDRIMDIQDSIEEMINSATEKIEDIEARSGDVKDGFIYNDKESVVKELEELTRAFKDERENIQEQFDKYGDYLDKEAKEWLEDQLDILSDRLELFSDEFGEEIDDVVNKTNPLRDSDGSQVSAESGDWHDQLWRSLNQTEIGRTINMIKDLPPQVLAITAAMSAIKAIVKEIGEQIQEANKETREIAQEFNEAYTEGTSKYQALTDTLEAADLQNMLTPDELQKALVSYGNRYAQQLSDEETMYLALISENTQESIGDFSKMITRMKQQGAQEDAVIAQLRELDTLDKIGANTESILEAMTDYSKYVDVDTAAEMSKAEDYMMNVGGIDISDINEAIAKMDLESLPDYIKTNSEAYQQLVDMTLGGQYDAQTVIDAVLSGLNNMSGMNSYTAANAFGIYNRSYDVNRFAENPYSDYYNAQAAAQEDQYEAVRAGVSSLQEITSSIDTTLKDMSIMMAEKWENQVFMTRDQAQKNAEASGRYAAADWLMGEKTYEEASVNPNAHASGVHTNRLPGSHKTGLDYVPYDEYKANLHEGERVLTAQEARSQDEINDNLVAFIKQFSSAIQFLGRKIDDIQVQVSTEAPSRTSQSSRVR